MTREQFIHHVEGTQSAFRRFLCALCCGDRQLADDIAQESYIKAWLSAGSISDAAKFKSWLFRIGYNTFLNNMRAERHTVGYDEVRNVSADDSADSEFRYQELYMALAGLPPKERTAVLLFYLEGYSVKEIAAMVDAGVDAVKQHLSRGRSHLRGIVTAEN